MNVRVIKYNLKHKLKVIFGKKKPLSELKNDSRYQNKAVFLWATKEENGKFIISYNENEKDYLDPPLSFYKWFDGYNEDALIEDLIVAKIKMPKACPSSVNDIQIVYGELTNEAKQWFVDWCNSDKFNTGTICFDHLKEAYNRELESTIWHLKEDYKI